MEETCHGIFKEVDQWLNVDRQPNILWIDGSPGEPRVNVSVLIYADGILVSNARLVNRRLPLVRCPS
jgi:hypothetical protein